MKTRLLSFALALVLALGLTPSVLAAESGYTDVPEDHWAAESVQRSTELHIQSHICHCFPPSVP